METPPIEPTKPVVITDRSAHHTAQPTWTHPTTERELSDPVAIKFPHPHSNVDMATTANTTDPELVANQIDIAKTSFALMRDAMDSLGRSSKASELIHNSIPQLGAISHRVDIARLDQHLKELEHSPLFGIGTRGLWQSVCPSGIDMLVRTDSFIRRPTPWFDTYVINTIWANELRMAMWSIMAVGYYAVTYSPSPDHPDMLMPHVLSPHEYTLWWTVDQHGNKYPRVTPRGLPLSPYNNPDYVNPYTATDDTPPLPSMEAQRQPHYNLDLVSARNNPHCAKIATGMWRMPTSQFEAVDVYVDSWPSDDGELRSRSRSCIAAIVRLDQLQTDMLMLANLRANVPIVTQSQTSEFSNRFSWGTNGDGRISASTFTNSGSLGGGVPGGQGGLPILPTRDRAEDVLGLQMYEHSARAAAAAQVSQTITAEVAQRASALSVVPQLRTFDPKQNIIVTGDAPHAWRNGAFINLPPGVAIVPMPVPDIPKALVDEREWLIATICTALEIPPEMVLGTSAAHIATSALSQASIRASVEHWRNLLARRAEMMYWRLFGEATLQPVFEMAARSGVIVTRELAHSTVMDLSVSFSFRTEILTPAIALELYNAGILTREEMISKFMSVYGLLPSAFQNPTDQVNTPISTERKQPPTDTITEPTPSTAFPHKRKLIGADTEDPNIPIAFAQ